MGTWEKCNDTVNLQQLRKQILAMQKAYDNVVSPGNIAKTILDKLKGFNPFNLLVFGRISVLLFICFLSFSQMPHSAKTVFGLKVKLHCEHLRNKNRGRCGERSMKAHRNLT
jgi:hypothetical protein